MGGRDSFRRIIRRWLGEEWVWAYMGVVIYFLFWVRTASLRDWDWGLGLDIRGSWAWMD